MLMPKHIYDHRIVSFKVNFINFVDYEEYMFYSFALLCPLWLR